MTPRTLRLLAVLYMIGGTGLRRCGYPNMGRLFWSCSAMASLSQLASGGSS